MTRTYAALGTITEHEPTKARSSAVLLVLTLAACQTTPTAGGKVTSRLEIYGARSGADLTDVAALGFTQVILEDPALIAAAERLGLDVVVAHWWNPQTDHARIVAGMRGAGAATRLVSVNLMDEPIYNDAAVHPPRFYVDLRARLRGEGFGAPLSLTLHGPRIDLGSQEVELFAAYLPAVDVLRIDPYPVVAGRPLREVFDWLALSRDLLGDRRPVTVVLQAWARDGERLPSIPELRVMACQALLSGADVISFYEFRHAAWTRDPEFEAGLRGLIQELLALVTELGGLDTSASMSADGVLTATVRSPDGQARRFTVNTTYGWQQALAPLEVRVDPLFSRPRASPAGPASEAVDRPVGQVLSGENRAAVLFRAW